jgi:hypothetical protein
MGHTDHERRRLALQAAVLNPLTDGFLRRAGISAGHDHVVFEQIDINDHNPSLPYDAVLGRHILVHTQDALGILRKAAAIVHAGGVVAFQEGDFTFYPRGFPDMPLMFWALEMIVEFFRRSVPRPGIGTQLFHLMQEAGLQPPECRAESVMDGGPHSPVYEWVAETVRSLLPRMEGLGMTVAADVDIDTLGRRLREEALEKRGVATMPMLIGAFARKPHEG